MITSLLPALPRGQRLGRWDVTPVRNGRPPVGPSKRHLRSRVNPVVFMVVFIVAVLVVGLAIFFYWRSQYGVWAQDRKKQGETKSEAAQTIHYD